MIGRLAMRSLSAHPVRSAVLAAGFGAGVEVMDSRAACRTYNILASEGRKVVAAILLG